MSPIEELVAIAHERAARLPAPSRRRQLRLAAALTLAEVGSALGVTPSAVMHWERGGVPRGARRAKYAALLEGLAAEVGAQA